MLKHKTLAILFTRIHENNTRSSEKKENKNRRSTKNCVRVIRVCDISCVRKNLQVQLRVGGFDCKITEWGGEDVELHRKYVKQTKIHIIRAAENSLRIVTYLMLLKCFVALFKIF